MQVGDYVRTKTGHIFKITGSDIEFATELGSDGELPFDAKIISQNIIDLIEVGDFVTYKNGNYYFNIPTRVCGLFDELTLSTVKMVGDNFLNEVEITSIVTKEQFKNMEYKVGVDKE